jgi:tRNA-splicing ligase RtcB
MPDVHFGKGATIGSVIATQGAIIPSAVGVDIGCGMMALKLNLKIDQLGGSEKLRDLRHSIERSVPVGRDGNKEISERVAGYLNELKGPPPSFDPENRVFKNACLQLGSLGGGNHFIEVCRDQKDFVWILLHSGSRNIGKHLAEQHIERAKDLMKQYFISLPDPDLAYLAQGTAEFKAYLADLMWAQDYAHFNRVEIAHRVLREVGYHLFKDDWERKTLVLDRVHCHHNYTQIEHHFGKNVFVTRKGAVSARAGEKGIIPGSMGTRSYIVEGKGNPDSFCSCAHGAGRRMSRTQARATFSVSDLETATAGVECRKDDHVLDEIPGSYKSIDQVMENQADLVEVLYELKQVLCVKG